MSKRSTPIVAIDNNSDYAQTPYCDEAVGPFSYKKTHCFSVEGAGKVNSDGNEMIEIGSRHKLSRVNTFYDCGPTWFGRLGESRKDVVWLPRNLTQLTSRCVVLKTWQVAPTRQYEISF